MTLGRKCLSGYHTYPPASPPLGACRLLGSSTAAYIDAQDKDKRRSVRESTPWLADRRREDSRSFRKVPCSGSGATLGKAAQGKVTRVGTRGHPRPLTQSQISGSST